MTPIVEGDAPRYLPSGHLVYRAEGGTMMAARFDPETMKLLSTPVAVMVAAWWSLSNDGKLFYSNAEATLGAVVRLVRVDRSGQPTVIDPDWTFDLGLSALFGWSISPDGSMIAARAYTPDGWDIWVKQLETGPFTRLTFGEAEEWMPVWEPRGRTVTFLSDRNGNFDVWSRRVDVTGEAELILDIAADIQGFEWSPDGQVLLLSTRSGDGDILMFRPGTDTVPSPLLTGAYQESAPAVSPDGRWIAYSSNESGRSEIYVRPFPDAGSGRWPVSIDGGRYPRWAHSGRELVFESQGPDPSLMAVSVESEPTFKAGSPVALFPTDAFVSNGLVGTVSSITPDDQHFVFGLAREAGASGGGAAEMPDVILVNNFFEELKRIVPK